MTRRPLESSVVLPLWRGRTAAILAAGPSIQGLDLSPLNGIPVVAINHAWTLYSRAHTAFGGDLRYFRTVSDWDAFKGHEIVCLSPRAWEETNVSGDPRTVHYGQGSITGLESNPRKVSGRKTCVAQALSFLHHRRARTILLVGVDLKLGPKGERYAYNNLIEAGPQVERTYQQMYQNIEGFVLPFKRAGVKVLCCSSRSRLLDFWPYVPLDEVTP